MLEVTVYATVNDEKPVTYEDIDFVSYISGDTYGPPALIAPPRTAKEPARAEVGQKVLYINTQFIPMVEVERVSE